MSGCYPGCFYYTDSCFRKDCKMQPFEFNDKKYIPVKDSFGDLVGGCRKCAFYDKPELCNTVDGDKSWSERCASRNVHYEEVK